ncbi:MAG: zinc dependent phospholipase C family protein [Betaproteobacteria bacterium]|nr:zinc dependent phospholipase C family protein [Betaproteobacteria bacterium]
MAGAFTHLSIVRSIYADPNRLSAIPGLTPDIRFALQFYSNFVDLGAISPDCAYFDITDSDQEAASWANVMHYWRTGDFVREAIAQLRNKDFTKEENQKTLAWLFGYASHLVTDLTVHPVVGLRVGEYETHKSEHRFCELQQDAYMFFRTLGIEAAAADYIKGAGLKSCTNEPSNNNLYAGISKLWIHSLSAIRPSTGDASYIFGNIPNKMPRPRTWFKWFCGMIDKGAENGCKIPILSHFLLKYGFSLPKDQKAIDMSYVNGLATPDGENVDFPVIFEMAVNNTIKYWGELAAALRMDSLKPFSLPNANLDSGKIDETDTLIFWSENYNV